MKAKTSGESVRHCIQHSLVGIGLCHGYTLPDHAAVGQMRCRALPTCHVTWTWD